MRWVAAIVLVTLAACKPQVAHDVDLRHANARVQWQTSADHVLVFETDVEQPYDVLADLQIIVRQSTAFGDLPTRDDATRELRKQAARIGAHAVVLVEFGQMGMSWWSYNELRGHGRAIRFR